MKKLQLSDLQTLLPKTETPQQKSLTLEPGAWIRYEYKNSSFQHLNRNYAAQIAEVLEGKIIMQSHFRPDKQGREMIFSSDLNQKYFLCSESEGLQIRQESIARLEWCKQLAAELRKFEDVKGGFGFAGENNNPHSGDSYGGSDQDGFLSPGYD